MFVVTLGCLSSDIINGICIPWGVSNYATPLSIFTITYLMPLMMILFCYTRIVYKIRHKVIFNVTMTSDFCYFHALHAGTVLPKCYKDDVESQYKNLRFDPRPSVNA